MARIQGKTTDAVEILRRRFVDGNPAMETLVQQECENLEVAQEIYRLRTEAKLTQQQLADLVGTQASAICRLEDADYDGHSLRVLRKVAAALNARVEVRFVPMKSAPPGVAAEMAAHGRVASSHPSAEGKPGKAKKRPLKKSKAVIEDVTAEEPT